MKEIWQAVTDYEGSYEISNFGRVKSCAREVSVSGTAYPRRLSERIMRPGKAGAGYRKVTLCESGVNKEVYVHHLVARAFLHPVPGKRYINHIDGDKTNNHASNLEYCTHSENHQHAVLIGLRPVGEKHQFAKLSELDVRWIHAWHRAGYSSKSIATSFGVHARQIRRIVRGERWLHVFHQFL